MTREGRRNDDETMLYTDTFLEAIAAFQRDVMKITPD